MLTARTSGPRRRCTALGSVGLGSLSSQSHQDTTDRTRTSAEPSLRAQPRPLAPYLHTTVSRTASPHGTTHRAPMLERTSSRLMSAFFLASPPSPDSTTPPAAFSPASTAVHSRALAHAHRTVPRIVSTSPFVSTEKSGLVLGLACRSQKPADLFAAAFF